MLIPHLPPQPVPLCVIALVIVTASTDLVCRRIPNLVVLVGLVGALAVQGCLHGPSSGSVNWLTGALTGFALLLPFYLMRGMAAGDVKLLLTIGAWVGPTLTLYIALATFILGGLWSVVATVRHGRFTQLLANLQCLAGGGLRTALQAPSAAPQGIESVGSLPYGVAIAAGTIGVLFATAT